MTKACTRRQLIRGTVANAFGVALSGLAVADEPSLPVARAKHLIVLWMNGGPSHVDTFDPKDGGPFRSIATRAAGVRICEHLPQVAEQADKLAMVRSMSSKEGNHERARYYGHTGYAPNPTVSHPSLGAWISANAAGEHALPRFISVGGPSAAGGFLGPAHAPFVMRGAGAPEDVAPGVGVDGARFGRRVAALDRMDRDFAARTGDASVAARQQVYGRARRMMDADALGAFALDDEPAALVSAYGDSDFGRGCLLARRLVEAGVAVVEVALDGWDTHQNNFDRTAALMRQLDPAMATLLSDLAARDKLDETIVLWMGEFGRTPAINGREGRDHHPGAWSAVLAGGSIRGGVVHGATDERGERVVAGKVALPDLFATVAWQLGLDPSQSSNSPGGRPIALTDGGAAIRALMG